MGVTLARLRRYDEARTVLEESVAHTRRSGERLLEAHGLAALADVSVCLGRVAAAREYLDAAAALRRELGDEDGAAQVLGRLRALNAEPIG
jgi:hypothetical protein